MEVHPKVTKSKPTITLFYRGKNIRVFLSGDYEFLSNMYGLSGASGKLLSTHLSLPSKWRTTKPQGNVVCGAWSLPRS